MVNEITIMIQKMAASKNGKPSIAQGGPGLYLYNSAILTKVGNRGLFNAWSDSAMSMPRSLI